MDTKADLGEFLRSRRARLSPEDVGLPTFGGRRRVPGLRREELAQLAGVSVAYYTRLEQGQSTNASDGVLDAIARALRLTEQEITHLRLLARPGRTVRRTVKNETVRASVKQMLDGFDNLPALVIGRRTDVLAWNRLAHLFLASHLDWDSPSAPSERPNMVRMVFLDPNYAGLYVDWKAKAKEAVAYLRLAVGKYPDDPKLEQLVGELSVKSPDFASLWSNYSVQDCGFSTREYHHPLVGKVTIHQETMQLPEAGQRLIVLHTDPGSPSQAALQLLQTLSIRPDPAPADSQQLREGRP